MQLYLKFAAQLVMLSKWNCRWDVDVNTVYCSEAVKIIFSAMRSTIREFGEKSVKRQGHNVTENLIKIVRYFFLFLLSHLLVQIFEIKKEN